MMAKTEKLEVLKCYNCASKEGISYPAWTDHIRLHNL